MYKGQKPYRGERAYRMVFVAAVFFAQVADSHSTAFFFQADELRRVTAVHLTFGQLLGLLGQRDSFVRGERPGRVSS